MSDAKADSPEMKIIRAAMKGGGDDRVIARACGVLNGVRLSVDQYERGIEARASAMRSAGHLQSRNAGDLALEAFCEAEGLLPADVAAFSIGMRESTIAEVRAECGIDLKKDDPALYAENITGEIHRGYFRMIRPDKLGPDGELLPLGEMPH